MPMNAKGQTIRINQHYEVMLTLEIGLEEVTTQKVQVHHQSLVWRHLDPAGNKKSVF